MLTGSPQKGESQTFNMHCVTLGPCQSGMPEDAASRLMQVIPRRQSRICAVVTVRPSPVPGVRRDLQERNRDPGSDNGDHQEEYPEGRENSPTGPRLDVGFELHRRECSADEEQPGANQVNHWSPSRIGGFATILIPLV